MNISDSLEHDDEIGGEAYMLQLKLVHGHAENARLDSRELLAVGFEVVQVRGLPDVLWKMDGGPHDGSLFTTDAALREIAPPDTIPDPRDEEDRG